MNTKLKKVLMVLFSLLLVVSIIAIVFIGYIPVKYDYSIGSIAKSDIYSTRNVIDNYQTQYDARIARNSVSSIIVRSDSISADNQNNVKAYYQLVRQARARLIDDFGILVIDRGPIADSLIQNMSDSLDVSISYEDVNTYFDMSSSVFNFIEDKANSITELVNMECVEEDQLSNTINSQLDVSFENEASLAVYKDLVREVLEQIIVSNAVFDNQATNEAADNAYNQVMSNPVEIEKGSKIISSGQLITEHEYQILEDLELIADDSFNFGLLLRVSSYVLLVSLLFAVYLFYRREYLKVDYQVIACLAVVFFIPIISSLYLSELSKLAVIVVFFTAIASTYLGVEDGFVFSVFLLAYIWPMYSFNTEMIIVQLAGIVICSILAGRKNSKNNTAALILLTAISVSASSLVYNFLNNSTRTGFLSSLLWSSLSALISIVASVGLMPIFELVSNSVSPIKLIDLSQPSHPLLRQLFIEAPGTSQHSMMVANLADAAADSVGADSLLCRVASYYHDIGKLTNPEYFTENQKSYNPHDVLSPEDSTRIITSHTIDGVSLANKYHLPKSIIDIIEQHHGTTYPGYFYSKAKDVAKIKGAPQPLVKDFEYNGPIPQSKEAAIVMIADTVEAAVKSAKITDINSIETMIRDLIKKKIDADQLIKSDLSFDEIEKIISSFLNIYSGLFHERIKYPDENKH